MAREFAALPIGYKVSLRPATRLAALLGGWRVSLGRLGFQLLAGRAALFGTPPGIIRLRLWSCFRAPAARPLSNRPGGRCRRAAFAGDAVATQPKDVELTEAERKLQDLRRMLNELREAIRETEVMLQAAERKRDRR